MSEEKGKGKAKEESKPWTSEEREKMMTLVFEEKQSREEVAKTLKRDTKTIGNQIFNMKEKKMKDLAKQLGSSVKESNVEKGISFYKTKEATTLSCIHFGRMVPRDHQNGQTETIFPQKEVFGDLLQRQWWKQEDGGDWLLIVAIGDDGDGDLLWCSVHLSNSEL
ncbi:hypothetical protein MRB53_003894 [Persea americana]|uniref:Uncharacterized protein n=2 Tax=Persea americana TaxID=3435 RepID=A0ACC2MZH6_PERAE|nr:hypothetical protein MRB53_003893 [Persea americana]KAJ8650871.1 hypothetical protein MRB53_003894 [Persea americana]